MSEGRTVVLGGSGFIGTRLVGLLLDQGHQVVIGDIQPSARWPDHRVDCDVRDLEQLRQTLDGAEVVYNLAAEHRDDVRPLSLYDDVNVGGARNVCQVCTELSIHKQVFTSSVAIYGLPDRRLDESAPPNPFNDYGRTKLEAEQVYRAWLAEDEVRTLVIVRPTVVFGEDNRGNVYNLMKQIHRGPTVMFGDGTNRKSMAYVGNISAFLTWVLDREPGEHIYNYVDQPDFDMNTLVRTIRTAVGKSPEPRIPRIPRAAAMAGAGLLDGLAELTGRRFPISRVRVKKFTADTMFSSDKAMSSGFEPPFSMEEALRRTLDYEFSRP